MFFQYTFQKYIQSRPCNIHRIALAKIGIYCLEKPIVKSKKYKMKEGIAVIMSK